MRPTARVLDTPDVEGLIDVKFVEAQSCWQDGEKRGETQVLPELLQDVPITIRKRTRFQQDASLSFMCVLTLMPRLRPDGLGVVDQCLELPDLLIYRHLKNLVYATPVDADEDLVARISKAAAL
ncbi:hypothetical protein TNCV_3903371 [Trichonephila clavipes]|nr:hypothetical protein TNCV_3903371 [Trichonephila clavipes]